MPYLRHFEASDFTVAVCEGAGAIKGFAGIIIMGGITPALTGTWGQLHTAPRTDVAQVDWTSP